MKKLTKWIVFVLVLLLVFSVLSGCAKKQEAMKETELTVNTAVAETRYIAKTSHFSGTTRGINESYVMAAIPARVTAIYVKPGDYVLKGQTLLTLDSKSLQAALKQAEAALASARAGEAANKLQLENAKLNYERMLMLHEAGAVADNALEGARLQYESLNSGTVEASVAAAEAALAGLQTQIDNCNLSAPIDGVVGTIGLSLGEIANPQSPAAIISDTSRLEIEVTVSENEINYIDVGNEVNVTIAAVSEEPFKAVLDSVAFVSDPLKKNYVVKVIMDNPENRVKSGMFARVNLATISAENALCVPVNAVIPRGGRTLVFTIDKEGRARAIEVKTGISNNEYIEITAGLKAGTTVITKGNTLVSDGTLVKAVAGGEKQ